MGSDFFSMCDLNIAACDVAALCSGDFSECSRNLVDATFHVLKGDVNSLFSLLVLCTPLHSEPNNTQFMQKAPSTFCEYASHGNKFNHSKRNFLLSLSNGNVYVADGLQTLQRTWYFRSSVNEDVFA